MRKLAYLATMMGMALLLALPVRLQAQESRSKLLVLNVDSDSMSDGVKADTLAATRKKLAEYPNLEVLDTPNVDLLDLMVEYECLDLDASCLSTVGKKYGAELVLFTRWAKGTLEVRLIKVADGTYAAEYKSDAEEGKVAGLVATTGLEKTLGPIPVKVEKVDVTIDANVEAAEVYIDEKAVGVTPLTVKLDAGDYVVSIRKDKFMMVEEKLKVTGSQAVKWSATLKPIPPKKVVVTPPPKVTTPTRTEDPKKPGDDDKASKPFYATWWFWTAVGVGTAAIVTGTVLALSGSDSYDTGTIKFSVHPSTAEKDAIFYLSP